MSYRPLVMIGGSLIANADKRDAECALKSHPLTFTNVSKSTPEYRVMRCFCGPVNRRCECGSITYDSREGCAVCGTATCADCPGAAIADVGILCSRCIVDYVAAGDDSDTDAINNIREPKPATSRDFSGGFRDAAMSTRETLMAEKLAEHLEWVH